MINQRKFALLFGCFLGGIHVLRSLCVGIIPALFQQFLNRVVGMHFIEADIVLMPFNFRKAVLLVVITFAIGMII